jgi:hypothetical protein
LHSTNLPKKEEILTKNTHSKKKLGMDIADKISFVYSLYDFDGMNAVRYEALCMLFRSAAGGLSKICPPDMSVCNSTLQDTAAVDCLAAPFTPDDYVGVGYATPKSFYDYCSGHPIITSWLRHFSSIKKEPVGTFRGMDEVGLRNVPKSTYIVPIRTALKAQEAAVNVVQSDFDDHYTPSVRARTVHVEKVDTQIMGSDGFRGQLDGDGNGVGEGENIVISEEKTEGADEPIESGVGEKDDAEVVGEEGGDKVEGGEAEGEGKEDTEDEEKEEGDEEEGEKEEEGDEGEGEAEEKLDDQDLIDEDNGEDEDTSAEGDGGGEGESAIITIKVKLLSTPHPFDIVNSTR